MSVSLPSIASFHQGAHSVAVVGLGYVGLPLAVAFARHFNVIGFDLNAARAQESGLVPGGRGFPDCGAAFVPWRGRRVRVHGLSGRDRRGLRPDP